MFSTLGRLISLLLWEPQQGKPFVSEATHISENELQDQLMSWKRSKDQGGAGKASGMPLGHNSPPSAQMLTSWEVSAAPQNRRMFLKMHLTAFLS